jgi:hypothetical protein
MAVYKRQALVTYERRIRRFALVGLPAVPLSKAVIRFF